MQDSGYLWVTSLWIIFVHVYIFKIFMINMRYLCTKQK